MAIREIRVFGDPVLRTVCAPVAEIDEGVRALVQDLLDTVDMEGRAGLAATQIGHTQRVFSLNIDGEISYVINPEIVSLEGEPVLTGEGCLSVPDLWFEVPRHPRATVRGIDLNGDPVEISGEGLLAQALQHECDHLEGKLYLSRLDRDSRGEAMRQIRSSSWF
ncbi:peptide deformylase [Leucobacter chromiiresistens]|uniref:Peptide deformylase n=1 Tax=Leucobacter chromiiresistens TaxID=1079994 RepID=A0A147EQ27_9MICO|nr:peptide deformylase [Leucobacter chromiiresistens]KTR86639.1 peptide deformylase [Leucobacter chromiiresistens]